MLTLTKRRLAGLTTAALMASAPIVGMAPADAAGALPCRASMSDSTPKQYSNVFVRVKTAGGASVQTVAHYKTTKTTKKAKASAKGQANVKYYISGATPGYKVRVAVTVRKGGKSATCSTAFTPHK